MDTSQDLAGGGERPLAAGCHTLPKLRENGILRHKWHIHVKVYASYVTRTVCRDDVLWSPEYEHGESECPDYVEVIWPTWPTNLGDEAAIEESPLKDLQDRWDDAINRLRDSAKWMATVLGAALASIVPTATASFADLSHQGLSGMTIFFGLGGLACLSITLLLVLMVLRPQSVSYADIEFAHPPGKEGGRLRRIYSRLKDRHQFRHKHLFFESAAFRWQSKIRNNPDLYLPCGVYSLKDLRHLMTVEEVTLTALSRARNQDETGLANMSAAQQARAARLHEYHSAAAKIVIMGNYYKVRALSTSATCGATLFGFLGIVAIITAIIHWPGR